ncbi:hypothetical protein F5X97DRAFT_329442 [Nemania serpens]|nr:hypothetical protein F5X97DRAFT_329442 [Nemania serpens]
MSYPNGLAGDRDLLDALATFFNEYFRSLIAASLFLSAVFFERPAIDLRRIDVSDGFDWLVNARAGVKPVWATVDTLDDAFKTSSVHRK